MTKQLQTFTFVSAWVVVDMSAIKLMMDLTSLFGFNSNLFKGFSKRAIQEKELVDNLHNPQTNLKFMKQWN